MNLNLTPKQINFLGDTMLDYDRITPESQKTTQGAFIYLCDKMLASEDKEIKIDFSRVLMYEGVMNIMERATNGITELLGKVIK